jgi:EAL domain-containing protein (putative c-di-GMP-specific phosphodiesterase class I)
VLAGIACDEAQGFFLGRAMPAHALPKWLECHARQTLR